MSERPFIFNTDKLAAHEGRKHLSFTGGRSGRRFGLVWIVPIILLVMGGIYVLLQNAEALPGEWFVVLICIGSLILIVPFVLLLNSVTKVRAKLLDGRLIHVDETVSDDGQARYTVFFEFVAPNGKLIEARRTVSVRRYVRRPLPEPGALVRVEYVNNKRFKVM